MNKFCALLLVASMLLWDFSFAGDRVRTFKFHSDKDKPDTVDNDVSKPKTNRKMNFIRKQTRIDPLPEISNVPTEKTKRLLANLDSKESAYDACKISGLCNNGNCRSKHHEYYCDCPQTYYGKTCEFIADQTNCQNHRCMNNATCYSTKHARTVPNPDVLESIRKGVHDLDTYKNIAMSINYECWCRQGFQGAFCEFSEGMRQCAEDKCNHHGIVVPFYKGSDSEQKEGLDCKCHCEDPNIYSGDECEIISPCRDLECENGGSCVINPDGLAECKCPSDVQLFPLVKGEKRAVITFTGERCERIHAPEDVHNWCYPCQRNFSKFIDCFEKNSGVPREILKPMWWGACEKHNATCYEELKSTNCFNNGICTLIVATLPSSNLATNEPPLYLLPKCKCVKEFEGTFCEREIAVGCISFPEEKRCVKDQGTCDISGTKCNCKEGFKGDRCELKDPCYLKPCGEALCVELPVGEMSDEVTYTCICRTSQGTSNTVQKCTGEHYSICSKEDGSPQCLNDGDCYPCSLDDETDEKRDLCTDNERVTGFRCICPPGFKQPFCQKHVTGCDSHRCLNGADCILNENLVDYSCECQPGYNGTFCHIPLGICLREGLTACINGECVEDETARRKFSCDCVTGFEGMNCDFMVQRSFISFLLDNFAWTLPLITFIVLAVIAVGASAYQSYVNQKSKLQPLSPAIVEVV